MGGLYIIVVFDLEKLKQLTIFSFPPLSLSLGCLSVCLGLFGCLEFLNIWEWNQAKWYTIFQCSNKISSITYENSSSCWLWISACRARHCLHLQQMISSRIKTDWLKTDASKRACIRKNLVRNYLARKTHMWIMFVCSLQELIVVGWSEFSSILPNLFCFNLLYFSRFQGPRRLLH